MDLIYRSSYLQNDHKFLNLQFLSFCGMKILWTSLREKRRMEKVRMGLIVITLQNIFNVSLHLLITSGMGAKQKNEK